MRERIKEPLAPEVVEYLFKPQVFGHLARDFRHLMWINKAHALMLLEQGILSRQVVKTLLEALTEMERDGVEKFDFDPNLEDTYLNMEHALIERIGSEVGGRLHTGRSRNDLYSTMTRLAVRETFLSLVESLFQLRLALLDLAQQHVNTVMPGYTHLQPAQPTTLGHYLTSVALALERDGERLLEAYTRLNLNPLGACAFAGTGFPIDRGMTAHLLGFDGVVESTLDAVASRDYISELLAALTIMGVTVSRLAQDIYLWCSDEWGTAEVGDDVSTTSSIMPQKRNPFALEHVKAKAGHLVGALVSTLTVQKGLNFMHCRDMSYESVAPVWDAFGQAEAMIQLTRRTLVGLQVDKELMLQRAAEDFSTATELADLLVREKDMPFRLAHAIVANVVGRTLQEGLRSDGISSNTIERAATEVTGQPLNLTPEQVKRALDPITNLEGKMASGSPVSSETRRLIDKAGDNLSNHQRQVQEWRDHQQQAQDELEQAVAEIR